jgi:hypothetical protein
MSTLSLKEQKDGQCDDSQDLFELLNDGRSVGNIALGVDEEIKLPFAKRHLFVRIYVPYEALRCGSLSSLNWKPANLTPGVAVMHKRSAKFGIIEVADSASVYVRWLSSS